jgi:hypothetical protein
MRTRLMSMAALVMAGALTMNAQTPSPQTPDPQRPTPSPTTPQNPPRTGDTPRMAPDASSQVVTITGCLKQEKDVPGLTPNPAERVGVTDDFILTASKMAQSSKVSGLSVSELYEVEGIQESELKKHLNHQVELTGTIGGTATATDRTPNFNATSMKMVAATCPAQ